MLYGNVFNSLHRVQGTYIERQLQLLKRFPYRFAMFHGRHGVIKTSRTLHKTLQKRVHVGFLFSLLHVLKIGSAVAQW